MKAFFMYPEQDFDLQAQPPQNEPELSQDLELDTLLGAMSRGDRFLYDVAKFAVLSPLTNPEAIRFRQAVLADCLAQPAVLRRLYELGLDAIAGERRFWRAFQSSPQAILSRSVQVLEFFLDMLKELRAIADEQRTEFHSAGFRRFFTMIGDELDDGYFELVARHLSTLHLNNGTLISAQLGTGIHGTGYVLREQREQGWIERLTQFRRSGYSFQTDARDVAGMNAYAELNDRGLNLVANALAQSAERRRARGHAVSARAARRERPAHVQARSLRLGDGLWRLGSTSIWTEDRAGEELTAYGWPRHGLAHSPGWSRGHRHRSRGRDGRASRGAGHPRPLHPEN